MNDDARFEKQLRQQTLRPIPGEWRGEILRQAARAVETRPSSPGQAVSWLKAFRPRLTGLLWPVTQAWGALAAVWVVILALHFAARDAAPQKFARQSAPPSAEERRLLKQQEQLFVELIGPVTKAGADRSKPTVWPPHSRRRDGFFNA